jgi:creatinine amidohydrolase
MQWEHLTCIDFKKAVKEHKVCILPLGIMERHGDHLPLGTDEINVRAICLEAAEKEPAVVFPPFYWGQIYEAKHHPGTITLPPTFLLDFLLHTLDEIGRNGFEKIIIVNGHGGNNYLQEFLAQCVLDKKRPYTLYLKDFFFTGEAEIFAATHNPNRPLDFGHGGEIETALIMVNAPETVKIEYEGNIREDQKNLPRAEELPGKTPIWWYARAPEHYEGTHTKEATPEMGRAFQDMSVKIIADFIGKVKIDSLGPELTGEFYSRL